MRNLNEKKTWLRPGPRRYLQDPHKGRSLCIPGRLRGGGREYDVSGNAPQIEGVNEADKPNPPQHAHA
jgi:hypothetical protein